MLALHLLCSLETTSAERLTRRSDHPYLTYSDANIARLKERIRKEPGIAEVWSVMLEDANRMLESSGNDRSRRGRGRRRGSTELLCLAYRMTGEKRFGERVKQRLFSHELGGRKSEMLMRRNPPWHAGLDTGENCQSFAIAYDTVYDLLTAEERKTLAEEGSTSFVGRRHCKNQATGL